MDIVLGDAWKYQRHTNMTVYNAEIQQNRDDERFLVGPDVDFILKDTAGKFYLPHSYFEHGQGTTLEYLPLKVVATAEKDLENLRSFSAGIDWDKIGENSKNLTVEVKSDDIQAYETFSGKNAVQCVRDVLRNDVLFHCSSKSAINHLNLHVERLQRGPSNHMVFPDLKGEGGKALACDYVCGDGKLTQFIRKLEEVPQALRLLSQVAAAQQDKLENYYADMVPRFAEKGSIAAGCPMKIYSAAALCSTEYAPAAEAVWSMVKDGYNKREIGKALQSTDNFFRDNEEMMEDAKMEFKRPRTKMQLLKSSRQAGGR